MAGNAYGGLGRSISTGIGGFFLGNDQARQAGEAAGLQRAMMEDRMVQGRADQAMQEELFRQKQADAAMKGPDAARLRVLGALNLPTDLAPQVAEYQRTGRIGAWSPSMPVNPLKGAPTAPAGITPQGLSDIARYFGADQMVQAGTAKGLEEALRAPQYRAEADLNAGIATGGTDPSTGAKRNYAIKGSAPFSFHEFGVGDNLTGQVDASGAPAQGYARYRGAQTQQAQAGAAENYAQAGSARASADLHSAQADKVRSASAIGPDGAPVKPAKPMPPAALKMQQEALDVIGTGESVNADLASLDQQLATGKLKLGIASNVWNKGRNYAGISTEGSRNLASFQATMEKLRNDSLRLNKGVQTEGDAVRAWNELITNINDPELVRQRLAEIQVINRRATDLQRMNVEAIRSNFGQPPLDMSGRANLTAAVGGQPKPAAAPAPRAPVRITSDADYNALPPGTRFLTPDGKTGTKR